MYKINPAGKCQFMVRVTITRTNHPRFQTGLWVSPYHFSDGEINCTKASNFNLERTSDLLLQQDDGREWKEELKSVKEGTLFYTYFFQCTYRLVRRLSPKKMMNRLWNMDPALIQAGTMREESPILTNSFVWAI